MAKILIVSQHYWPEDFRLNDFSEILTENHHEVTVLTGQPNYPQGKTYKGYTWWKFSKETRNGIRIYRTPLFPRHKAKAWHLILNYLSFNIFTLFTVPYFLFKKTDHVISWGTSPLFQGLAGAVIAFVKRIPMTVWVLDLWPESLSATNTIKHKGLLNFVLFFVKIFYSLCDNILCTSESFIAHIKDQGVNPKKLKYFPNWAEDLYKVDGQQEIQEIKEIFQFPEGTIITYAGNLGVAQDIENIFQTMKLVKDVANLHFVILGDGRQKEWLETHVKSAGLKNVHILGRFPAKSMPYFFKRSHAFLITLKSEDIFSKTLPGRVISFMAAGKPLIGAAGGETERVILKSQSGLTANPGNPEELALVIKKFVSLSSAEKEKLGANALKYFHEYFAREKVYNRFKALVNLRD